MVLFAEPAAAERQPVGGGARARLPVSRPGDAGRSVETSSISAGGRLCVVAEGTTYN